MDDLVERMERLQIAIALLSELRRRDTEMHLASVEKLAASRKLLSRPVQRPHPF